MPFKAAVRLRRAESPIWVHFTNAASCMIGCLRKWFRHLPRHSGFARNRWPDKTRWLFCRSLKRAFSALTFGSNCRERGCTSSAVPFKPVYTLKTSFDIFKLDDHLLTHTVVQRTLCQDRCGHLTEADTVEHVWIPRTPSGLGCRCRNPRPLRCSQRRQAPSKR